MRYVCGQTINPTAICTFLERPTDLDVHPKNRFAFLAKIVEIDVAELGKKTLKFALCGRTERRIVKLIS